MLFLTGIQVVGQVLGQEKVGPGPVALMLPLWSSCRAVVPHPSMGEMPWPPKALGAMSQDSSSAPLCPTQSAAQGSSQQASLGLTLLHAPRGDRVCCVGVRVMSSWECGQVDAIQEATGWFWVKTIVAVCTRVMWPYDRA